ncbi:MAG TPA: YdcF family protein [Bryobacteraceae bacterium]|nr:YdcF family protein [Bryobacteraceae bacterium]
MAVRFSRLTFLAVALVFIALIFLTRSLWLPAFGYALIHDDGPAKAELAVVLAGDAYGHRIVKGGDLVRAGYVPAVLVSGPAGAYGLHECDLAIPFAVRQGFPAEWFIPFPNRSLSTKEEAAAVLGELRRRNVKSFLLVTSDYHSARARRIFLAAERSAGGPPFRTVAAPDEFFQPDSWWRNRQGQKIAFIEWSKTFATAFGL